MGAGLLTNAVSLAQVYGLNVSPLQRVAVLTYSIFNER